MVPNIFETNKSIRMKRPLIFGIAVITMTPFLCFSQNTPSPHLIISTQQVSCNGKNDGKIVIVNNSEFLYKHQVLRIDDTPVLSDYTSDLIIKDLPPGSYKLRSVYLAPDTATITHTSQQLLVADVAKIDITSFKIKTRPTSNPRSPGVVELTISGGTPPYSITKVSPSGKGIAEIHISPAQLTNIENTYYSFMVSDKNNCLEARRDEQIPLDAGLVLNPEVHQAICGEDKPFVSFDITGGTAPYTITYKKEGGASLNQSSATGKIKITITEMGIYSFEIKDAGGPAKVDNGFKWEFRSPVCQLNVKSTVESQPSTANSKGGKVRIKTNGDAPFKVAIKGMTTTTLTKIEAYPEFVLLNFEDGDYTIEIEDANLAKGRTDFKIETQVAPAEECKKRALEDYSRYTRTYAQVELKRRNIRTTKQIIATGWTTIAGAGAVLTSGATAVITTILNIAGNATNVFTNNKNFEALTKASQYLSEKLDPEFMTDPGYFNNWTKEKYTKFENDLASLNAREKSIKLIDDMPPLKNFSVKKLAKIPDYNKYGEHVLKQP